MRAAGKEEGYTQVYQVSNYKNMKKSTLISEGVYVDSSISDRKSHQRSGKAGKSVRINTKNNNYFC